MAKMHVKKGDKVLVLSGKDKGKEGEVLHVYPQKSRVVVEKVNLIKKAMRPTQSNPQGGISTLEAPIHVSNVALICPACNKAVRVNRTTNKDGKKQRICKSCGKAID